MKPYHYLSILLFSCFIFSCSKEDGNQSENPDSNIAGAKINNYLTQPYNDEAFTTDVLYLENGNYAKFSYTSPYLIEYTSQEGGNFPNGDPRFYVQFQLDTNNQVTTIISRPQLGWSYRYVITYTADNYVDEMKIYETSLNDNGFPQLDPTLFLVEKLTWEDGNLVKRNQKRYHNGEFTGEADMFYSGFLPENINTLGAKNFGFDFFGKGGIPLNFLGRGQYSAFFHEQMFAGKLIPTKMIFDPSSSEAPDQITNYTITRDSQGRIKECKTEDGDTWRQNKIFTYLD